MYRTGPTKTRSGERGQAIVEFGIIVVILFLLVSGIVDFGRALTTWVVMANASRDGARVASVGASSTAITQAVHASANVPGIDPSTVDVTITWPAGNSPPQPGDPVTVQASADEFQIITPLVRPAFGCKSSGACKVPISSSTTMRYEGKYVP